MLLARLVVGKSFADFLHLRLEQLHLAHRRVGFVGEREERQFYKQRQQQDREPKIAEQPIEKLQGQKDRFRQEIEPAKIDREIEMRNARFGISIEKVDLLGARKKAGRRRRRAVGRHGYFRAEIVALVAVDPALDDMREPRLDGGVLGRDQRGQPVFVGEAKPAAGRAVIGRLARIE